MKTNNEFLENTEKQSCKSYFISRLLLKLKKWKLQNKYYQLDMDMQSGTICYKEYCKEIALLNFESISLNGL